MLFSTFSLKIKSAKFCWGLGKILKVTSPNDYSGCQEELSIFSSMGLICTEIPSPTSVPVGHNGGILHREHLQLLSQRCFNSRVRTCGQDLYKVPNGTFGGSSCSCLPFWQNQHGRQMWALPVVVLVSLVSYSKSQILHRQTCVNTMSATGLERAEQGKAWVRGFRPRLKAYWPCW